MFTEHSTETIVKTKSWGFWLILALVITGAYTMVFGVITVQQVNEELVVEEYVDMNQFIPFYDWFNGDTPLEHPALETSITELNNHTLREVFESGNITPKYSYNTWVNNSNGDGVSTATNEYIRLQDTTGQAARYKLGLMIVNNWYYSKVFLDVNSGLWQFDGLYTGSRNEEEYSLKTQATLTLIQFKSYITSNPTDIYLYDLYIIDMTSFGISSLTVAQMDEYYNQYEYYKNYTDFDIYSLDAYNVSRETLIYYHELYQKLLVIQGERAPVKIVSVNPAYNVELGASIMATLKNTADFIQTTADGLPRLYNDIKNIMGDIGKWFN